MEGDWALSLAPKGSGVGCRRALVVDLNGKGGSGGVWRDGGGCREIGHLIHVLWA